MAVADEVREAVRALALDAPELEAVAQDLVTLAHLEHDPAWTSVEAFLAHAWALLGSTEALAACHGADLYLAFACSRGVRAAIDVLERSHLARVPRYAAAIDPSPAFGDELTQRLRARVLVGTPPRIATYAGRGPLSGWVRMAAVRLAGDLARELGREVPRELRDVAASELDPEIALMKRIYGESVSRAFTAAIAELEGESRTLLRMHYVDGLTIDQVGLAMGVSRATGARALARARLALLQSVRQWLAREHALATHEADSLLRFVRSRIDLSIATALRGHA